MHKFDMSEEQIFLFNEGRNYESYKLLGAHIIGTGCRFGVWAPNALSVSVVCDKNNWNRNENPMSLQGKTGIWYVFIEGISVGERYKFCIETQRGEILYKTDPFAFECEVRPNTAAVVADLEYSWRDEKWMSKRNKTAPFDKPLNIYEVHLGSWKRNEDKEFLTYDELSLELIPYVKEMGYTHIELMPVCEYPYDGSWGYQVGGYYAANSRFGKPASLKAFVDSCHRAGLGVIMDWVPAHFPRDAHGLARFDGSCLFEHPDSRLGEHKEWGTLIFNWEKTEIYSFLISNAVFWLGEYHMDGLRVDAVSSMLYLDYNRRDGEWLPNKYGGNGNLFAIEFLKRLNKEVFMRFPNVLMIAEESTAWEGVTRPVHQGGLGFNFKWNMGWMNDILRFMAMDPYFRGANHNMLTFPMMYAYSENYILPLSHDEVVHGKGSLLGKMYGDYEQKFKSLKLLYAFMYAHPGKKLSFMGNEFGQFSEWKFDGEIDRMLTDFDSHRGVMNFAKDLNRFYTQNRSMYENDDDWNGFRWIDEKDCERSTISFMRISKSHRDKTIAVLNFAAQDYKDFETRVPGPGEYAIVLNTDWEIYGGKTKPQENMVAEKIKGKDGGYKVRFDLPELSAVYIKKVKNMNKKPDKKRTEEIK